VAKEKMMRYLMAPLLMVLLHAPFMRADDDTKKDKPKTAQEQFDSLVGELETARTAAGKAMEAAKTDDERERIVTEFKKKLPAMAPRMLELGEKYPKEGAGGEALLFAIMFLGNGPQQDKAISLFLENHKEKVQDAAITLLRSGNLQVQPFYTAVLNQKDSSEKAKGFATLGMAVLAKKRLEDVDPNSADAVKFSKEAEDLFQQILTKFKDMKELVSAAETELFVIRNLSVGKVAPDIEGTDSDGKRFKLSDYRGKVVVLDFWALWCGPCMALIPHEQELVKRLEGKPFAMIGVSFDESKEVLKKGEKEHDITWRSFHDGQQGPIGEKWRIQGIPAIFVLDAKGVIRYKDVRGKKMDEAVDGLLKEMGVNIKN
jgi:thiol-disulfide isomerase/thioredoxin